MSKLPEKMQALIAYAPGDYRLEEVTSPRASEGEIVVKVEACGICAGDLKAEHGAPSFWGGEGSPSYIKAPMIPGHEFIGNIVEMGTRVKGDFKIGDRVISEQIVPCWKCKFCTTGRYWMCQKHDVYAQYTPKFRYTPFEDVSKNICSFIPSWRRNKSATEKIWEEKETYLADGVYAPSFTYSPYLWYRF